MLKTFDLHFHNCLNLAPEDRLSKPSVVMPNLRGHKKTHAQRNQALPQTIALLMSRARATHSKLGYPEALISFETQTFSSLVSAPTCERRAENKSVSEKAAP